MKFLDSGGVQHLWSKVKSYVGDQLGTIDRTLYKIITKLPNTAEEAKTLGCTDVNKIYLIALGGDTSVGNQRYEEYIYRCITYATKYNKVNWEKLGSSRSTVDLSNYLDKTTDQTIGFNGASVQLTIYGYINLQNDGGITGGNRKETEVFTSNGGYLDISAYAKKTEIPNVSGKVDKVTVGGSGNAVTAASISGSTLTLTKGATFLTAHQDISGKSNIDHTHKVKINGVVKTITASGTADASLTDLGTYLTTHQVLNTLTLQKNGQQIGTYNPRTASTLNITVPTKLSGFTDDVVAGKYLPLTGGDITGPLTITDHEVMTSIDLDGVTVDETIYSFGQIENGPGNVLTLPSSNGTIALTSDISTYVTSNVQKMSNDDIDKVLV